MKLNYAKKSKNPTYFVQQGFRNGKKTTTKNIYRIGKHDELLAKGIADHLEYTKSVVQKYNDDFKSEKVDMEVTIDFDQKVLPTNDI